jgi:hypothetical protein
VARWTRLRTAAEEALRIARKLGDGIDDGRVHVADEQHHAGLGGTRADELLGGAPAAVVVATHDEADAARAQQGYRPSRRIAAIQHQHIIGPQPIQRLHQHGALGHNAAVHAGMQEHRGVCGHHPQAAPALDQAGLIGAAANNQVIERDQHGQVQMITPPGKRPIRHAALKAAAAVRRGKKAIEHGLLGLVAHRHQCADQCSE